MKKAYFYYRGKVVEVRQAERDSNGYYRVEDVIDWFLLKSPMSPKKLQKLLYYSYAWTLTLFNENSENLNNKLFDEVFEAWIHGPVIPGVYRRFKKYRYNNITKKPQEQVLFDEEIEDVLNQVWDVYGHFSGNELENLTHQETPWKNARKDLRPLDHCDVPISDKDIFECYGSRI